MNSHEIEKRLKEILIAAGVPNGDDDTDEENYSEYGGAINSFLMGDCKDVEGLEVIHFKGGMEQGSSVVAVFLMDSKLYRATWSYYSHHGYDFDDLLFTEVKAVEKTITVYEPIVN